MAIQFRKLKQQSTNVRLYQFMPAFISFLLRLLWNITPTLVVGFVKKHVFSPAEYRPSLEEIQILKTGSKFRLDIHGKPVYGWKWGEGPGVLFVHGWNGRGIQFNRFISPLLRAGYSAITFDAPGHGESGGKTSSYFELTDTVRAMMNLQNGFSIKAIIGHSLGGSAIINALSKEHISLPAVLIAPALRLKQLLFNTFNLHGIPEVIYRKAIEEYEHRFGYTLESDDPCELLPALGIDLLIVHDRQDQAIPFQDSEDIAKAWPNVVLHETEGLGHKRILADRSSVELISDYVISRIRPFKMPMLEFEHNPKPDRQTRYISPVA